MAVQVREATRIAAAPERVWPLVSDLDRELEWRSPYLRELALVGGEELAVGARVRGTTKVLGQTDTYVNEITGMEPRRRLAWRGIEASGGATSDGSYELAAEDGATRFTLEIFYEPKTLRARVSAPALKAVARRLVARTLLPQLRRAAESGDR